MAANVPPIKYALKVFVSVIRIWIFTVVYSYLNSAYPKHYPLELLICSF
jgi:hypothetical protein